MLLSKKVKILILSLLIFISIPIQAKAGWVKELAKIVAGAVVEIGIDHALTSSSASASTPNINVNKVKLYHQKIINGKTGMIISSSFNINNLRGHEFIILAAFYDSSGKKLINYSNNYHSQVDGQVVAWSEPFTSPYDGSKYTDYSIFIPYEEINWQSHHNLKLIVEVQSNRRDIEDYYGKSNPVYFSLN